MATKVVMFNAPPRSGKDLATTILCENQNHFNWHVYPLKFASPLRDVLKAVFQVDDGFFDLLEENNHKDHPRDEFFGHSFRKMMIHVSEHYLKPLLGKDCMGKLAVSKITKIQQVLQQLDHVVVFSDLGFSDELEAVCNHVGIDNVLVVHIKRDGCDFSNDSRNYVNHKHVVVIENNSTLTEFKDKVLNVVYNNEVLNDE